MTEPSDDPQLAATRSHTYRLFARLFEYPGEAEASQAGGPGHELHEALAQVDSSLVADADWNALATGDELAVEYTRLFDVGVPGPPCPLYGGLYASERMQTMEEALRFYRHFGLTSSPSQRELPDHLTVELEFLHFLTFKEAEALEAGADPGPFRRAQRDFIARHPGRWVPTLASRLEAHEGPAFFRELARLLGAFLAHDAAAIASRAERSAAG